MRNGYSGIFRDAPRFVSLLPILDDQAVNASKFSGVVRDDRQPVRQCRGGDHQVSGTDAISGKAQARVPFGMNVGDMRVKRQARKQGAK